MNQRTLPVAPLFAWLCAFCTGITALSAAGCGSADQAGVAGSSIGSADDSTTQDGPTCPPHIDVAPVAVYGTAVYPPEALPTGACTTDQPECRIATYVKCATSDGGPRTFYACTCGTRQWSCRITSQDLGTCAAP